MDTVLVRRLWTTLASSTPSLAAVPVDSPVTLRFRCFSISSSDCCFIGCLNAELALSLVVVVVVIVVVAVCILAWTELELASNMPARLLEAELLSVSLRFSLNVIIRLFWTLGVTVRVCLRRVFWPVDAGVFLTAGFLIVVAVLDLAASCMNLRRLLCSALSLARRWYL